MTPQGRCWNGQQGNSGDFVSGLARQIGNDLSTLLSDLGGLLTGDNDPAVDVLAANVFGSNNTNIGILGSDLAPGAELVAPAIRVRYLFALSRIEAAAGGSARTAVEMRNALKWARTKTYEQLLQQGKSDADILKSAGKSNMAVNAANAALAGAAAAHRGC